MSMSLHVVGIKPADEEYNKKREAYLACEKAGVSPPAELQKFFDYDRPGELGIEVDLTRQPHDLKRCVEEYRAEMADGYTLDVTKLPEGVRYVRFYASF